MAAQYYKINYKSDFVLTINSDAGWAVPFCIKFWTGMPSQAYFVGFDGENYVNCRVGDTPTQLLVMFDDHHMPIGELKMQIAYHTTIEEFPDRKFDEVTNPTNVTVDIDGTEYQVMLDFTGESGAEIDFSMPSSGVMSVNGKIGYVTLNAEDVGAQPTIEDLSTIRSGAASGATAVQPATLQEGLATKQDTINDLATIRSGAAAGATAVQPATLQEGLATKQNIISDLATIRSGAAAGATAVQPATLQEGLATKQDVITDLSTIRSGAAAGATAVQPAAITPIENDIDAIEGKIPSAASASNQLADKAFVNSALADKADTSDIPTALSQLSQDSTHRVVTDAEKSTWNGKQNAIDDLATIRSGAAAGATAVQPAAMNTALAAKQDTLTFDNTPTANSNNPVKSSGIKTALDAKQSTISTVNVSVDNNTGTPSGSASVSGSTLSLSFQNLKGATGATGATGPQGPQGERGLPGESGVTGDVSGFTVIQTIDPSATYGATDIAGAATVQATNAELTELAGDLNDAIGYNDIFPSQWISGTSILSGNGNAASSSAFANYSSTDYLDIEGWLYDTIVIRSCVVNTLVGYAFYDYSKSFIAGGELPKTTLQDLEISVPSQAAYLRYCCMTNLCSDSFWKVTSPISEIINKLSLQHYVTPQMFGAVGDGVTDDYSAFVKASNASNYYKVDLRIPYTSEGYMIDASNFVNDTTSVKKGIPIFDGQHILGDNAVIKIEQGSLDSNIIVFYSYQYKTAAYDSTSIDLYNITIEGVTVEGNENDLLSNYSMTGFAFNKCNYLSMRNCHVKNMSGTTGAGYGIIFAFSNFVSMEDCSIERTDRSNIYVWETQHFNANNCFFKDSYTRDNLTISTNSPKVYQKTSVDIRDCKCVNTLGTGTHSIRFSGESEGIIDSCEVYGVQQTSSTDTEGFDGIYIIDVYPQIVEIANCKIYDCYYGIRLQSNANRKVSINNNYIYECNDAIRVDSEDSMVNIYNNLIKGTIGLPLYILSTYADVEGNIFDGIPWSIKLFPKNNLRFVGNKLINYGAIQPQGYLAVISNVTWAMILFNYSYRPEAKMRCYSDGIAIGNHCGFDSTSLSVMEFNG